MSETQYCSSPALSRMVREDSWRTGQQVGTSGTQAFLSHSFLFLPPSLLPLTERRNEVRTGFHGSHCAA